MDKRTDVQCEIERTYPGTAEKARNGSRLSAVKLFCIECHGGNAREARQCVNRACFIWGVRGSWTRDAAARDAG